MEKLDLFIKKHNINYKYEVEYLLKVCLNEVKTKDFICHFIQNGRIQLPMKYWREDILYPWQYDIKKYI